MDFILNSVAGMMNTMSAVLGGWSLPADAGRAISSIAPYLKKANMFVPISTAMIVFSVWIALQLVLMAYYWINRAINLLRGAG